MPSRSANRHLSSRVWIIAGSAALAFGVYLVLLLVYNLSVVHIVGQESMVARRALPYAPLIPAVVGLVTGPATLFLAWRNDRRAAREMELKLLMMQEQIRELEKKTEKKLIIEPGH
jgi:hypothetical protein